MASLSPSTQVALLSATFALAPWGDVALSASAGAMERAWPGRGPVKTAHGVVCVTAAWDSLGPARIASASGARRFVSPWRKSKPCGARRFCPLRTSFGHWKWVTQKSPDATGVLF